jgi:hypothetical protein
MGKKRSDHARAAAACHAKKARAFAKTQTRNPIRSIQRAGSVSTRAFPLR